MKALRLTEDEYRALVSRRQVNVVEFPLLDSKQTKYRNKPTSIDGHRFPSKKEARRYVALKLLERAGKIKVLALQVRWPLTVNGIKVGTYVSDFSYFEPDEQPNHPYRHVVEDCKGFKTPLYKMKKLLMFAIHGIKIKET